MHSRVTFQSQVMATTRIGNCTCGQYQDLLWTEQPIVKGEPKYLHTYDCPLPYNLLGVDLPYPCGSYKTYRSQSVRSKFKGCNCPDNVSHF